MTDLPYPPRSTVCDAFLRGMPKELCLFPRKSKKHWKTERKHRTGVQKHFIRQYSEMVENVMNQMEYVVIN